MPVPRGSACKFAADLADRPLIIEADHEQLRQLFLNLLCNALDTLPQGGSIQITAVEAEPASDKRQACEPKRCKSVHVVDHHQDRR